MTQSPTGGGYDSAPVESKRIICGVFAIILGGLGIHKFILGMVATGIIMLVVSIITAPFTCGFGYGIMGVIGLIEGIIYLTRSDAEFVQTYQIGRKQWF